MTQLQPLNLPQVTSLDRAERPALLGREPLSYWQLDADVEGLAAFILSLGTIEGDRIALWTDKGNPAVVTILAALRAGCAYVPIDGGQPAPRALFILNDATPKVLFTDMDRLEGLDLNELPRSIQRVVVVGEHPGLPEARSGVRLSSWQAAVDNVEEPRPVNISQESLAAILYTSGSTGMPKGVQISHGNLANFVSWAVNTFDIGSEDVFANHASFNFDLSTFDMFVSLTLGASLWVIEDRDMANVDALIQGVKKHKVTVWYSVPSILRTMAESSALNGVDSLRYVLFAGEVFPMPHLRKLVTQLSPCVQYFNLYGPTETNVCTYYHVRAVDLDRMDPVPIGKPISGAKLSVVDDNGVEVKSEGECGELLVCGQCVSPGYWKGKPSPPAPEHERVHHTGDLVSWEREQLVYRGRKDRMVKLAGYRVELGEVEAAVLCHPAVQEAAVVLQNADSNPSLVLYYTLQESAPKPSLLELKRHCAGILPKYMLPRTAVCLAALPHNRNGKIDYRQLIFAEKIAPFDHHPVSPAISL